MGDLAPWLVHMFLVLVPNKLEAHLLEKWPSSLVGRNEIEPLNQCRDVRHCQQSVCATMIEWESHVASEREKVQWAAGLRSWAPVHPLL